MPENSKPARVPLRVMARSEAPSTEGKQLFISRADLASRWGCSVITIKRFEHRGILQPVKLAPRMLRYRLAEIEEREASGTLNRTRVIA